MMPALIMTSYAQTRDGIVEAVRQAVLGNADRIAITKVNDECWNIHVRVPGEWQPEWSDTDRMSILEQYPWLPAMARDSTVHGWKLRDLADIVLNRIKADPLYRDKLKPETFRTERDLPELVDPRLSL